LAEVIDLFADIASPEDWVLRLAAEAKWNAGIRDSVEIWLWGRA
jgi:hypothetical protein